MGIFLIKKLNQNKEKISYKKAIEDNEIELKKLYESIASIKKKRKENLIEDEEISLINQEIQLYENIFKYNNTNEKDILEYLLLYLTLYQKNKITKENMEEKLDIYNNFISDENYNLYFNDFKNRINSFTKTINLLNLLQINLDDEDPNKQLDKRKDFISKIIYMDKLESKKNIKLTKNVTWNNIELYLYSLYEMLLVSLVEKINYYKQTIISESSNQKQYNQLVEDLILAEDKTEKLKEFQLTNVCESIFISTYIYNLREFLVKVNNSFIIRYTKNSFKSDDDKCIYEDYMHFLSNYKFDLYDIKIINLWNETFNPINDERKIELIKKMNNLQNENNEILGELKNNILILSKKEKSEQIDNLQAYCFYNLITDLYQSNLKNLDYFKNKNLKPNFYNNNLFIMKNKNKWKNLNIKILNSNVIKEALYSFFNTSYIEIVSDEDFLSEILDNVKFYIYKTSSYAHTNGSSLRLYEFGLYNIETTLSESLLAFYSFNTVSNIHEICGHINIRIQNFNLLDNSFDSPKIESNNNSYSDYAKLRNKESGETLEIIIFGRRLDEINIKEALFILEPNNYNDSLYNFKKKFKNCNSKEFEEIISEDTINNFFNPLGIFLKDLPKKIKMVYSNKINVYRTNESSSYNKSLGNHAPEFYFEIDREFMEYVLTHYKK